ncbi:hypothetical protein ACIFOC_00903 [Leucobacter aridicollis]|uniref:Glycosyltransferase involved in cell wall biosynthesis n=1 Tax=Leucobacter aridicollis TaxID=283878 RepID=A0A852RMR3_9MICO|nr:hypothetical protein [Leucobacter aridicollis]MBL3681054.1 hypothetical protein [Leucobacter aridicollis]NYD27942.1 glycosyltransferase involved in cell wall biosynthesis [Leucobacter aridicollis]
MARKILCISLTPIHRDARVLRQIALLAEMGEVTTIGFGEAPKLATAHIRVPDGLATLPQTPVGVLRLALRMHAASECSSPAASWVLKQRENVASDWDLVVANDARVLDLAFSLAGGSPVWADLHEWAPEERTHVLSWRLLVAPFMVYLCRTYLRRASLVTTVSRGIAELYREHFGVEPLLMTNAGPFQDIAVRPSQGDAIACVHSGAAIGGRGLETMIQVVKDLPARFTLDLFLVPGGDGGAHLRELQRAAEGCDRIRFRDPVTPSELPRTLSSFDLGLFWIPPTHTNARLTLPNKFFDYVQARIGVAIGPSEEMVRELREYGLGVVSRSFDPKDLADSLRDLDADKLDSFKHAADRAAEPLSFSAQVSDVKRALQALLSR